MNASPHGSLERAWPRGGTPEAEHVEPYARGERREKQIERPRSRSLAAQLDRLVGSNDPFAECGVDLLAARKRDRDVHARDRSRIVRDAFTGARRFVRFWPQRNSVLSAQVLRRAHRACLAL